MFIQMTATFGAEVADGTDLEAVAAAFDNGLSSAVAHFPEADVFEARVDTVTTVTDAEADERGWVE